MSHGRQRMDIGAVLLANESCKMIIIKILIKSVLNMSETTVQLKDKQHWSADQINR